MRAKPAVVMPAEVRPASSHLTETSAGSAPEVKATAASRVYHYPGNRRTALVIVAYNRPDYLRRTMQSLVDTLASPKNDVVVDIVLSQDGYLTVLDGVVEAMKKEISDRLPSFQFTHIHHTQENRKGDSGYHKLSRHFAWFLGQMFDEQRYEQVIILEVCFLSVDHAGRPRNRRRLLLLLRRHRSAPLGRLLSLLRERVERQRTDRSRFRRALVRWSLLTRRASLPLGLLPRPGLDVDAVALGGAARTVAGGLLGRLAATPGPSQGSRVHSSGGVSFVHVREGGDVELAVEATRGQDVGSTTSFWVASS